MTKDRISHFDDIVVKIRIEGAPIATAIYGIAALVVQYAEGLALSIGGILVPVASVIFYFGALYIAAIALLDFVHFRLLLISTSHARLIESREPYRGKLQITTKLTSKKLTITHFLAMLLVYTFLAGVGVLAAFSLQIIPS